MGATTLVDDNTLLTDDEHAAGIIDTLDKSNSGQLRGLLKKLVSKAEVVTALTALRQRKINEASAKIQARHVEGIGELVSRIDLGVFFQMRNQHGHNCWSDPEFIEAFLRDNPGTRIALHVRQCWNGFGEGNFTEGNPPRRVNCGKKGPEGNPVAADTAASTPSSVNNLEVAR